MGRCRKWGARIRDWVQNRGAADDDAMPRISPGILGVLRQPLCLRNGHFFVSQSRLGVVQILGKNQGRAGITQMVPKMGNP